MVRQPSHGILQQGLREHDRYQQDINGGGCRCYNFGEVGQFLRQKSKVDHSRRLSWIGQSRDWFYLDRSMGSQCSASWTVGPAKLLFQKVHYGFSFIPTWISLKWLDGYDVEAPTTTVKLAIGDFLGNAEVTVVTDEVLNMPIIGRNVREANLLALISFYGRQYHPEMIPRQEKETETIAPVFPVRTIQNIAKEHDQELEERCRMPDKYLPWCLHTRKCK